MKKIYLLFLLLSLLALSLAGCFALPVEEPLPPPPLMRSLPDVPLVRTMAVARGDVSLYSNVRADFVPVREEGQWFPTWGMRLTGIYVVAGDHVQAGDILAASYIPGVQEQLELALKREESLLLDLDQAERRRSHALQLAESRGEPVDDSPYLARIDAMQRELELVHSEIEFWHQENERRYLRASIDGVVTSRLRFTEDMTTDPRQTVATITDQTVILFRLRGTDLRIGDQKILTISNEPFLTEVVEPQLFGIYPEEGLDDLVYLSLLDGQADLPLRPSAFAHIVEAEVFDVLYVPTDALHQMAGAYIVYTINELGVRKLREVEIGLVGNEAVEIISGLEEGELILVG